MTDYKVRLHYVRKQMDDLVIQHRSELNRSLFADGANLRQPPIPKWRAWAGRIRAYCSTLWLALKGHDFDW